MPLIDLNVLGHFKDRENAMIAEDFSATKDYAAGDYCYYNGTLKKFKTTHAAGAWIGTDAEDANLAGDVSDLKSALGDVVYSGTISGTKTKNVAVNIPAGKYLLHIDSITSSDTDHIASRINISGSSALFREMLPRNTAINIFFEIFETATKIYVYAAENSNTSTGDTFAFNNIIITEIKNLSDKIYDDNRYITYPYHALTDNPYQCPFSAYQEVISTTHAHCVNDTQLVNYTNKYDHVAFSNYHPSVPWYPLDAFFTEPLLYQEYSEETITGTKYEQITTTLPAGDYTLTIDELVSSDTDSSSSWILINQPNSDNVKLVVQRGQNITANFTLTEDSPHFFVYAGEGAGPSTGDTFTCTGLTIYRKISNALTDFLSSPNAEHAGFTHNIYPSFHINTIGSLFSKETEANGETADDVISSGLNALQFAQMGGVSLNHPSWTPLTNDEVYNLINLYPFFAIEIYNASCEANSAAGYALTQWDYALAKGKQIFGLAVPDHEVQSHPQEERVGFGYCHVMVRAKTEQQILQAYSCGRFYTSIYNDTLKFTNLYFIANTGLSVTVSESCTIKFITANGTVSTVTGTTATYDPAYNDVYVRVEATDGTNTLYSNAIMLDKSTIN